jgi:hypothetical protein
MSKCDHSECPNCNNKLKEYPMTDEVWEEEQDFIGTTRESSLILKCDYCGFSMLKGGVPDKNQWCDYCKSKNLLDEVQETEHEECKDEDCMCDCRLSNDPDLTDMIKRKKMKRCT